VIAATNADLDRLVGTAFRRDLYERLRVFEIDLPPLRERRGDIRLLVEHLLPDLSSLLGLEPPRISDEAYGLFERYSWPGNVRELQNALKRAVMRCQSGVIEAGDVDSSIRTPGGSTSSLLLAAGIGSFPDGMPLRERLRQARRIVAEDSVAEALRTTNGDVDAAARALRVSRRTVERLRRTRSGK
jgi:DNA-binding NtrC family response regulator